MNFKSSEPTVEQLSMFVSATSATAILLFGVEKPEALQCSQQLWDKDPKNLSPSSIPMKLDVNDLSTLHSESYTQKRETQEKLSPLLKVYMWHIRSILVHCGEFFGYLVPQLGQPDRIQQIPIHKTTQIPCRSMNVKESTPNGNIKVLKCLLHQGGIGEPEDKKFNTENDVDMTESILLVHGDLLTKERLDTVQDSHHIKVTPKHRFQYVVFLPGLFHFKMACANAIWRTWVQPKKSRGDENSLYQHIGILRPEDTGKFGTKPGFRPVHDVIHHDIWASMLDCWRLEAGARNSEWASLKEFSRAKPSWEMIVEMSELIVEKYVATTPILSLARDKTGRERDKIFENQTLRNRDELLYLETSHAMNAGDIGRVEATFLPWIYMFKATGKHKYGVQMLWFVLKMRHVYDTDLQCASQFLQMM